MSDPKNRQGGDVDPSDMGDVSAKELSELKARLQPALVECLDEGGAHEGPLLKRGLGSTLTETEQAVLDAHLETCPNCQLRYRTLVHERAAHAARDDAEKSATFEGYLEEARAASTPHVLVGDELPIAATSIPAITTSANIPPTTTVEIPNPLVPIHRRLFLSVMGTGLAAAAAIALFFGRPTPAPVPIEVVNMQGQVASTMGPIENPTARPDPTEPAPRKGQGTGISYAPSSRFGITVRLTKTLDESQGTPTLLAFFERNGRLHAIPEQHVDRQTERPRWASLQLDVPVGAVFGPEAGPRRIFFASTYARSVEDFEGRATEEALKLSDVLWAHRRIEVITP